MRRFSSTYLTAFFTPVYLEISKKQYFQGFMIFILLFSPIYLLKLEYFPVYSENEKWPLFLWTAFLAGIIWHSINVIAAKNILPPVESNEKLYEKGRLALLRGNFELAVLCFQWLEKLKPDDEDVLYQLGKTYLEWGEKKQSFFYFKKYLEGGKTKWKKEIEALIEEKELR
ncbi:MAG: hypothetical protein JW774_05280 [Candidatus Aureabacteria bacterium]|nr:hypothetical protein [Candidatus Auribacterota bacterium]